MLITRKIAFNYALMTAVEELFEMTGILVFIYALMSYLMPSAAARKSRRNSEKNTKSESESGYQ